MQDKLGGRRLITPTASLLSKSVFVALVWIASFPGPAFCYIGGGAAGNLFPGAIKLYMGQSQCSATKVAEDLILTAAHCNKYGDLEPGSEVYLDNASANLDSKKYPKVKAKHLFTPRSWSEVSYDQDWSKSLDMMLVQIDGLSPFQSIPISSKRLEKGDVVIVGGFGLKGLGYPMYQNLTLALKEVGGFLGDWFFVGIDDFGTDTKSFGAEGDSGGAAYIRGNDGLEIVGVNSAIPLDASEEAFTVDPQSGALISTTAINPKFYITEIPDPSSVDFKWLEDVLPSNAFSAER